jgi:hypothetical protein
MEPEKKDRAAGRRWLLLLPLLIAVGGTAIVGGIWWLQSGTPQAEVTQGPAPPLAPEPPSPPAAWKAELAPPVSGKKDEGASSGLSHSLNNITGVVSALGPELTNISTESSAPAVLLVLPGDVRAVDAVSRIPRHERWEIQFPPGNTIDSYSRQLDFFKIELGVIGAGDTVTYLANLSAPMPTARSEPAGGDKRLYLIWQRGALREAAEELASRAKVDPRGKVLAHFCPAELETQLAQLEEKHAADKGQRHIRRTSFGIKPNDTGGYAFYVIEQKADE